MPQRDATPTRSNQQQPDFNGSDAGKNEASTALKAGLSAGVRDLSSEVQHVASDVAGEARKAAESKIGAGKDQAAEQLGAVANALRKTTEQLRTTDNPLTDYVEKAASSVDGLSHYLQTRTLSQLIGDVEGFARREPAIFLGGAFFAGLLGGRFLKSATPAPRTSANADQAAPGGNPWKSESRPTAQLGMGSSSTGSSSTGSSSTPTSTTSAPSSTQAGNPSRPASATNPSGPTGSGSSSFTGAGSSSPSKDGMPKTGESRDMAKKPSTPGGNGSGAS